MAIRKVPRDLENLEMLRLYGALDPVQTVGTSLQNAERLAEFLERARTSLERSVATPSRVHGLRAQALFRATLVALGQLRLLVDEDAGEPYYDDEFGRVSPPDFRVVDREGETVLIEVKSVKLHGPLKPFGLRAVDVEAWRRWGNLTGAPVALALWWAVPGQWTLTPLDRLRPRGSKLEIDLMEAMAANEMSRFGDCLLGTRPPLVFRLRVRQEGAVDPQTRQAPVRVTDVDLLAGGRTLDDDLERDIAFYFLRFGRWEVDQQLHYGPEGDVVAIDLVAQPPVVDDDERQASQDFASVGTLSSLYAALFDEATLSAEGEVDQLDHPPDPGQLANLIPDDFWDRADRALPLWRLKIQPVDPDTVVRG